MPRLSLVALGTLAVAGATSPLTGHAPVAARPLQGSPSGLSRTGTWTIDPMHSSIGFAIEHVGLTAVHGRFNSFSGQIVDDERDITKAKVTFTAQTASIDTAIAPRDTHLRSADFFDVERYPEMRFESTKIQRRRKNYEAIGNLTLHGVTRPITIPFRMTGPVKDGFGAVRRGITSEPFSIDRRDFGISWQQVLPSGVKVLSEKVEIVLTIEATPTSAGTGETTAPAAPTAPGTDGGTGTGTTTGTDGGNGTGGGTTPPPAR